MYDRLPHRDAVSILHLGHTAEQRALQAECTARHYGRAISEANAGHWEQAKAALDEALAVDRYHVPSIQLACRILADRHEWAEVARYMEPLLGSCADEAAAGRLLREIGDLCRWKLGDLRKAAKYYGSARMWCGDLSLMRSIVQVHAELLGWPDVVGCLERNADAVGDPGERQRYWRDAANIAAAFPCTDRDGPEESPWERMMRESVPYGTYRREIAALLTDALDRRIDRPAWAPAVRAMLARQLDRAPAQPAAP